MDDVPLLIEFAPHTCSIANETSSRSSRSFGMGRRARLSSFQAASGVSLPTDQIVVADDTGGLARSVSGE